MRCEEIRDQLADYVNDQLQEPVRSQVANHMRVCATCRTEADELKTLWSALGSVPAAEPSGEMRSRFNMMLQAYQHGLDQNRPRNWWEAVNSWLTGWWPRQPALQLGLSVSLLVIGIVLGGRLHPGSRSAAPGVQSNEVTELRRELYQTQQMVAVSLMQQQSASDRLKGVNWSYQLQQPGGEVLSALLDTLMHDPSVNVRLATVEALRQFGNEPVVRRGLVQAIAHEESPMVQVALIDLAVDLREKESIGTLRQLVTDQNLNGSVRQSAERGLEELE